MSTNKKITVKKQDKTFLEEQVMSRVTSGEVTMKPRWYFIIGSVLTLLGLVFTSTVAVFLTNLVVFLIKKRGPGYGKIELILNSVPLWIPICAVLGVGLGIWLLKKYDFSYKKNPVVIIIGFILAVALSGLIVDRLGLNDFWSQSNVGKRFYQQIESPRGAKPNSFSPRNTPNGRGNKSINR